jgi:citron Rho-interacting kinase
MIAMENSQPISIRINRINNIILGANIGAHNYEKEVVDALSREGLLDALFVLYEECSKDIIKNKDKNICDFVAKCKFSILFLLPACLLQTFFYTDRTIINETKSLRVNVEDFQVKSLIGKGYFGDVYVSRHHPVLEDIT